MFVVDTNVLLYAAETSFAEHRRCRDLLSSWRENAGAWYTTWGILYEFLRVSTHPRVFVKPWAAVQAWEFVRALLASPGLGVLSQTERHAEVAEGLIAQLPGLRGNLVHDAHTAVLMREHGIREIYTRDTDFHRFSFLRVIDPLT